MLSPFFERLVSSYLPQSRPATLALLLTFGISTSGSVSFGQTLGSSGTIKGAVTDLSHAVVKGATVEIQNPVTGYDRTTSTDDAGSFEFTDVPFNPYHLSVTVRGFRTAQQDVSVRTSVPIDLSIVLEIATVTTNVTVQAEAGDLIEQTPVPHTDVGRSLISTLPIENKSIGLSAVITNATPGVAADANGFFHPFGDHAQASISLDNQPINDQYSKLFSNQLSLDAIQSLEVVSGIPQAEYGDKTSLVINALTRSGIGNSPPRGSFSAQHGSFGTSGVDFTLATGRKKWGNFLSADLTNSSRYLDPPEFRNFHDKGNGEGIFDRIDWLPTAADTLHLNLSASRSWFQIPNTYDQLAVSQDQHQQIRTLNIAPGYTHLFSATTLLTFNPYLRLDHVQYYPSRNLFSDLPATLGQNRRLAVMGARADLSYSRGIHNAKAGVQFRHNVLTESFTTAVTDALFNAVCMDSSNNPVVAPGVTDPNNCAAAGFQPNQPPPPASGFLPGLLPFDLTRGGRPFNFHGHTDVKEIALYAQDSITVRQFSINLGVRGDRYRGLSPANQIEPRLGIAYNVKRTATILRFSYGRFLETPYNENLILSSATGAGGLATNVFGAFGGAPLQSGRRNQFNGGFEQAFRRHIVVVADYFWKHTNNAFDFDVLFSTPLAFPITWKESKLDGVGVRVNLTNIHGFSAYSVMGHTRARYFAPENGGVIFNSPVSTSVFRIDHDQQFQQSSHFQYQFPKRGPWVAFTWRYDSGLVAGKVPDLASALALDADQQAAIGFFCGSRFATLTSPIASCSSSNFGATRLRIPAPGTQNDDINPARITPRHLFDVGVGMDNLFRTDRPRVTLRLTAINITNQNVLYNFLSTFSGTHFVTPRVWQAELGFVF